MTRVLGLDPGVTGSGALYCPDEPVPNVDWMFDFPTVGDGNKRELHYAGVRDLIWAVKPHVCFIEQVNAFVPKKKNEETGEMEADPWGATSMARFMGSYYALRAVVSCLDIPLREVQPAVWKTAFNLRGKKKGGGTDDSARQLVLQRYPATQHYLKFKLHQHRAEAYLIAVYGARLWAREGENLDIPE
jgi:hypothetical protein